MSGQYTDEQLEADHLATGHTAPRITPEHVDEMIAHVRFWQPEGTTMTVCLLELVNGFQTIGYSAAASSDNFDVEIGRNLAREHARSQIWVLEGYLLRQQLHDQETQQKV
jgi:hypothetical protein